MLLYVCKHFSAIATGHRRKTVLCEKCATEFYYDLSRTCKKVTSAPHFLFQRAAKRRAEEAVSRQLAERLDHDTEMVPCPTCKWINYPAIVQYRKSRYRQWRAWSIATVVLGATAYFILLTSIQKIFHRRPSFFAPALVKLALGTFFLALSMLAIQWVLRRCINPNRSIHGNPRIAPGTPPALVKQMNAATGRETFTAIPNDLSNLQTEARWLTFRAGQLSLEPICCQCFAPATTVYKVPMAFTERPLPAPLCRPCLRKLYIQWWLGNLCMVCTAFFVGWFLASIPRGMDARSRLMGTIFLGSLAAVIGFALINQWIQPYRSRKIDGDRGVFKIRFKKPRLYRNSYPKNWRSGWPLSARQGVIALR